MGSKYKFNENNELIIFFVAILNTQNLRTLEFAFWSEKRDASFIKNRVE